jgi:membrane associated rhomboid family serine protease
MLKSIYEDVKTAWVQPNNTLVRLITINVAVFVVLNLVWLFSTLSGFGKPYEWLRLGLYLPAPIEDFAFRFWTILTYFFTHKNFLHILFNMMMLYWFGLLIEQSIGSARLLSIYILGGIAGGLVYLLCFNTIDFFIHNSPRIGMLGASASVYAVVAAAATFSPDSRMMLLFFGSVKIKYIAIVAIFLSLIGVASVDSEAGAGGNLAHLGGALIGYLYIVQLRQGRDIGRWISTFVYRIGQLFTPKPQGRKAHRSAGNTGKGMGSNPSQDEIDAILDKISEKGYASLTPEEKQILFKFSQKK